MAKGTYTYDPGSLKEFGKDRMRFELGDTMVEGLSDTTALTDEEIQASIEAYPRSWKRAKLMLLEFGNGEHQKPPYFYAGMQQNERAGNI